MRLYQTGRTALAVLALVMGALAVAGLLTATGSPTGVGHFAGFSLNIPHSLLLLVTAVGSALAALTSRVGRLWAIAQAILYTMVYVIGTAASTGHSQDTWLRLNTADHMAAAEVAVTEGNATPEQARRVQEDAQRRSDAQRRRAWNHFKESTGTENRHR
jgi:predicted Co/Zn/Cd cation transporter (cation efflux family)